MIRKIYNIEVGNQSNIKANEFLVKTIQTIKDAEKANTDVFVAVREGVGMITIQTIPE